MPDPTPVDLSTPEPDRPAPDDGQATPPARTKRKGRSGRRTIIEWVILLAVALVAALVIKTFLFQAFYVPSESMLPTIEQGDRVLVNKLSYRLHDVHRGDILVFEKPEETTGPDDGIRDLVKRVVGLPGETLSSESCQILVDGQPLDEPYLEDDACSEMPEEYQDYTVPEDSYFMMGDNRGASMDSRSFGPIPEDDIIGRVFVRIWPVNRLGFM